MNRKKKIISSVFLSAALIFTIAGSSEATENNFTSEAEVMFNSSTEQLNVKYYSGVENNINWFAEVLNSVGATIIPKSYLPSYKDQLTIKNQLINGVDTKECWALSFTSAVEAFNYAKNTSDKGEVYSARHMNQSCNSTFEGKTVKENRLNRDIMTAEGGNFYMATNYATSGYGPVLESDMPSNTAIKKIEYSALDTENGVQKHLEGYEEYISVYKHRDSSGNVTYYNEFDYNTVPKSEAEYLALFSKPLSSVVISEFRNNVKTQIKTNGGILAYIFEGDDNKDINYDILTYTSTGQFVKPNHAVLIVGWDDDYTADGWKNAGAYIALNSYGKDEYDNGYVYISYDDFYVEQTLVGITSMNDVDYTNIYQHDDLGANTNYSLSEDYSALSAVNIFDRDSSKNEKLTEVGVNSFAEQVVDVYYTESFDSDGKPTNFILLASDEKVITGYTTIRIEDDITLTKDKFAICVTFKVKDSNKAAIAIEANADVTGLDLFKNVVANAGESYIVYTNGEDASFDRTQQYHWLEMYLLDSDNEKIYVNASIKACTSSEDDLDAAVTSKEYTVKNHIITRVPVNTTMSTFKSKITVNGTYTIVDKDNKEVTGNLVRTGYKVKVGNDTYEIAVISDISGAGGDKYSRALDLAKMRSHIVARKGSILTGVNFSAADINGNGTVTLIDLLKLRELSVQ